MQVIFYIIYTVLYSAVANSYALLAEDVRYLWLVLPAFVFINIFIGCRGSSFGLHKSSAGSASQRLLGHGVAALAVFVASSIVSLVYHIILIVRAVPDFPAMLIWSSLLCIAVEAVLFWNGIISVYLTSTQLGIKIRVLGIIFGMVPVANLVMLFIIIKTASAEVRFEADKKRLNASRAAEQVCRTKYPILLIHGVFFRDSEYFNYWGRIPAELEKNGAEIHYGYHQSAASVADSAAELTARIKELTDTLGCEKVNIIAHSKGGLDCRYAMANCGVTPYVASLTTVNTPHRGCEFADYLLTKIPDSLKNKVASAYNSALRKFGDKDPDFLAAVSDLTASYCTEFDKNTPEPEGVFCQSIGSILEGGAVSGKFPLNFSYHLVNFFDGANDGLVSEGSFEWGERFIRLKPEKKRGISHGDVIDLNRENIDGFDVREFYVGLVNDLKKRGL